MDDDSCLIFRKEKTMKNSIIKLFTFIFCMHIMHIMEIQAMSVYYDDAFERYSESITTLAPSPEKVWTDNEIQKLKTLLGKPLPHLKALDLRGVGINDDFIDTLCKNSSLKRLIRIDLSNNEDITSESLKKIFKSDVIGSVRDLQQISGRYGIPSSEVYIGWKNTKIKYTDVERYKKTPRFDFSIQYLHPIHEYPTFPSVERSIKWLQFLD